MATGTLTSPLLHRAIQHVGVVSQPRDAKGYNGVFCVNCFLRRNETWISYKPGKRAVLEPISAVGSGLEASISDPKDNVVSIKDVDIVLESKEDSKMQVRVDVSGKETKIVFEKILRNLARSAPPVPGFRREKGGKTSKVPRDFLLQILGEDRVTNFVIQEIVSSTLGDYVKKEKLTVKDNKISTIQTSEELKSSFIPGNDFGFNATLELENSEVAGSSETGNEESV